MEVVKDLTVFFLKFVEAHVSGNGFPNAIVKKIIKKKVVQEVIVDCICKLEPIINKKLILLTKPVQNPQKMLEFSQSKLQLLSKDAKNLINNYSVIQDQLTNMKTTVNTLVTEYELDLYSKKIDNKLKNFNKLSDFLHSLSRQTLDTNEDFENIASDMWEKHFDTEKIINLKNIMHNDQLNMLNARYFNQITHIKTKTGRKIQRLEENLDKLSSDYINDINRLKMTLEDIISKENERVSSELYILNETYKVNPDLDLITAFHGLKKLSLANRILEKYRKNDELIIKSLNNKLRILGDIYSESQATISKLYSNNRSLSAGLVELIHKSELSEPQKKEFFNLLSSQSCKELESKLKAGNLLEDQMISTLSDPLNDKCNQITENKIKNELIEITEDTSLNNFIDSKAKVIKNYDKGLGNGRKSMFNRQSSVKANEKHHDVLQKVLGTIDKQIAKRRLLIATKIEQLGISEETEQFFYFKQSDTPSSFIQEKKTVKLKVSHEKSTQTVSIPPKSPQKTCYQQTEKTDKLNIQLNLNPILIPTASTHKLSTNKNIETGFKRNIDKSILETLKLIEKDPNNIDTTNRVRSYTKKEFTCTTERNSGRASVPKRYTPEKHLEKHYKPNEVIKKFDFSRLIPNKGEYMLEEILDTDISKEFTKSSTNKLEFTDLQIIWEEVLNKRIFNGEKDKISSYLRGYLGTTRYENEKNKVIRMLNSNKIEETKSNSTLAPFFKDFKYKTNILSRWKGIIIKTLSKIDLIFPKNVSTTDSPKEILYKAACSLKYTKNVKPGDSSMKKSETLIIFKDERWKNNSTSPTLAEKVAIKSKYLDIPNQTSDKLIRIKTPTKLNLKQTIRRLPHINQNL